MPRPPNGFRFVTQAHLERLDTDRWRLNISDGVLFFGARHVRSFVISRRTLLKLQKQIEKELNDGS